MEGTGKSPALTANGERSLTEVFWMGHRTVPGHLKPVISHSRLSQ